MSFFSKVHSANYPHLSDTKHVHACNTAGSLPPRSVIEAHANALRSAPPSLSSLHESTRLHILHFFNADPALYTVSLHSSLTHALHILAERYPFRGTFVAAQDNQTAVLAMQAFAKKCRLLSLNASTYQLDDVEYSLKRCKSRHSLFAYPAMSNYTGVKHPLHHVTTAQKLGYDVLVDATHYASTQKLDLSNIHPDYILVSFSHLIGHPSLACLLTRREKLKKLPPRWLCNPQNWRGLAYKPHTRTLEEGSQDVLSLLAVRPGLDFIADIGLSRIHKHTLQLATKTRAGLLALRYDNGRHCVQVFSPPTTPIVSFCALGMDGEKMDDGEVCEELGRHGVHVALADNPGCVEITQGGVVCAFGISNDVDDADKVVTAVSGVCGNLRRATDGRKKMSYDFGSGTLHVVHNTIKGSRRRLSLSQRFFSTRTS